MSSAKWRPFCLGHNVLSEGSVSKVTPRYTDTVKPVCNDHLSDKIYYLWFIQYYVLIKTECTTLLLLTISAFWSTSRWPLAT